MVCFDRGGVRVSVRDGDGVVMGVGITLQDKVLIAMHNAGL